MTRQSTLALMHPLPEDFLREIAPKQQLTDDETKILVACFSRTDGSVILPSKQQVWKEILYIAQKTFDAHFTRIYKKFGLVGQRPNKFNELYDLLKRRYDWHHQSPTILQMPPLPGHFVERPQHQQAVLDLLLCQDPEMPGTLVVSAIYGLGGIGKSVLAAALGHNPALQARFPDGILWVTLGQNPDILPLLSGWVQALRDYHFKPISIEVTTTHLRTLLYDKQVLLVVDDVWDAAHLEPFRVGRGQSRVLVTTRSAPITDAQRYDLDVMTLEEALTLLANQLGKSLSKSEQPEALAFAEQVGYLPLALELGAAQIQDGKSWADLLQTFQQEVVRLGALDLLSATELAEESTRRKYSLIACFNLSLRQLSPKQLRQFAWLGVLPDDVGISRAMTSVLWQVTEPQAGKVLRGLRSKALLLNDVTRSDRRMYRMHDLLHDAAMRLLVAPVEPLDEAELPGLGLELAAAHRQFLEWYRRQKTRHGEQWHTLADDGYIHAHLTWHMVQGQWADAVHALLQETTEEGRNGWFEACDALGQPAIFVSDVGQGWELAEGLGDERFGEALVLLWRYALIRATLNSLANNIPPELIGALVAKGGWSPAQGLAYVKLMQEPEKQAKGIKCLIPYLPKTLLYEALEVTRKLQTRAQNSISAFVSLTMEGIKRFIVPSDFLKKILYRTYLPSIFLRCTLEANSELRSKAEHSASAFSALAPYFPKVWPEVVEIIQSVENDLIRGNIICLLAPELPEEYWPETFRAIHQIKKASIRIDIFFTLVTYLPKISVKTWSNLLEIAQYIQLQLGMSYETESSSILTASCCRKIQLQHKQRKVESITSSELTEVRCLPQDESIYSYALNTLAHNSSRDIGTKILTAARKIHGRIKQTQIKRVESHKYSTWYTALAHIFYHREYTTNSPLRHLSAKFWQKVLEMADFPDMDEFVQEMTEYLDQRDFIMALMPKISVDEWSKVLKMTVLIENDQERAEAIYLLASNLPQEGLLEALEIIGEIQIQNEKELYKVISSLIFHLPKKGVLKALKIIRQFQDDSLRSLSLLILAPRILEFSTFWTEIDTTDQSSLLELSNLALTLCTAAPALPKQILPKVLKITQLIQDESSLSYYVFNDFAADLPEITLLKAFETARRIENEASRSAALCSLLPYLPKALLPKALEITRHIHDGNSRRNLLAAAAPYLSEISIHDAVDIAQTSQGEWKVSAVSTVLSLVNHRLPDALSIQVLKMARQIQDDHSCMLILCSLAPHLSETLILDALEITSKISDEVERSHALYNLAPHLSERLIPKALAIANRIHNECSRDYALAGIMKNQPAHTLNIDITQPFEEQFFSGGNLIYPQKRYAIATLLSTKSPCEVLDIGYEIQDEDELFWFLYDISPYLSDPLLMKAVEIADKLQKERLKIKIFSMLYSRSGNALIRENGLKHALEVASHIRDRKELVKALRSIFPYLSKSLLNRSTIMVQEFRYECKKKFIEEFQITSTWQISDQIWILVFSKFMSDWSDFLNVAASYDRSKLLSIFPSIKDVIIALAEKDTLIAMIKVTSEVCEQWP